eukprot:778854-Rhodomonas_salina.1
MPLRACYAVSGTDLCYAATRKLLVPYCEQSGPGTTGGYGPTPRVVLRVCMVRGTEGLYGARGTESLNSAIQLSVLRVWAVLYAQAKAGVYLLRMKTRSFAEAVRFPALCLRTTSVLYLSRYRLSPVLAQYRTSAVPCNPSTVRSQSRAISVPRNA